MALKFQNQTVDDSQIQIEITPLIDVVFLLLIFFMVSTTFKAESKLVVELPKATLEQESTIEPLLTLSLDRNGILEYRGNVLTLEELGDALTALTKGDKQRPILVRADKEVAHGYVVAVIDRARESGFNKISIATRIDHHQDK